MIKNITEVTELAQTTDGARIEDVCAKFENSGNRSGPVGNFGSVNAGCDVTSVKLPKTIFGNTTTIVVSTDASSSPCR